MCVKRNRKGGIKGVPISTIRNDRSDDTHLNGESDTASWKCADGAPRRKDGIFSDDTSAEGGPVRNEESADSGAPGWREGLEARETEERQQDAMHIQKAKVWRGTFFDVAYGGRRTRTRTWNSRCAPFIWN